MLPHSRPKSQQIQPMPGTHVRKLCAEWGWAMGGPPCGRLEVLQPASLSKQGPLEPSTPSITPDGPAHSKPWSLSPEAAAATAQNVFSEVRCPGLRRGGSLLGSSGLLPFLTLTHSVRAYQVLVPARPCGGQRKDSRKPGRWGPTSQAAALPVELMANK